MGHWSGAVALGDCGFDDTKGHGEVTGAAKGAARAL